MINRLCQPNNDVFKASSVLDVNLSWMRAIPTFVKTARPACRKRMDLINASVLRVCKINYQDNRNTFKATPEPIVRLK